MFRVTVLVGDGKPGLLRFVWVVPAASRDKARSLVRSLMRKRGKVVKHIVSTRKSPVAVGGPGW